MTNSTNLTTLCDAKESCLLLIDIQEKLTTAIPEKVIKRLRSSVGILIEAAKALEIPIITTAQYPKGLGSIESFITNALPEDTNTFEKTCFSCLGAESLPEHLKSLGKKQVILCGIEAHICVYQTAHDLQHEDYEVFVVNDGIASRRLNSYDTAIARMAKGNINLLTTEAVLFEWLRDSGHPDFRALSKLIV